VSPLGPVDHLLLVLIVLLWPVYVAAYRYPRLRRDLQAAVPGARLRAYAEGMAVEWLLLALLLVLWFGLGRTLGDLGVALSSGWRLWLGAVVMVVVMLLLTLQRYRILRDREMQEQLKKSLVHVSALLPTNGREMATFYALSVTAGVCEEILYRGYVLWYIADVTGVVGGVLLSSALFGLAHAYQGTKGMLQTGAVGLVLAILFVLSGTLWIPIILHAFLDINSGRLAYGIHRSLPDEIEVSSGPDDEEDA
jgi:membrane protease YdiL (CAAX protease family)